MTVAKTYEAGTQVIVSTYLYPQTSPVIDGFRDQNGALADPTTVQLVYRVNQGADVTLTYPTGIVKDGVGLYHAVLDTTGQPGLWAYRWLGTGTVTAPRSNSFNVVAPPL